MPSGDRNTDARRALGIRPGAIPIPSISLNAGTPFPRSGSPSSPGYGPPSPTRQPSPTSNPTFVEQPISPGIQTSGIRWPSSGSQGAAPPSPSSPNESTNKRFRRPTISRAKQPPQPANRGLYETQKLLAHLLDKLEERDLAPDLLERAAFAAREVSGKSKGKGKKKVVQLGQAVVSAAQSGLRITSDAGPSNGLSSGGLGISNEDYDERLILGEGDWDNEATYDLVVQLRELLVLANKQMFDLFAATTQPGVPETTPIKNRRKTGRFSSITSPRLSTRPEMNESSRPTPDSGVPFSMSGPNILGRLLDTLRNLIEVDCLHSVLYFGPFRPPNALQAACLDIASYLYNRCTLDIQLQVVDMVISGLYTMGEGMTERICEWLEGRMGELLGRLAKERGGPSKEEGMDFADPFAMPSSSNRKSLPTFAISEEPEEAEPAAKTPGWMRYSPTTQHNPFFPSVDLGRIEGLLSTHSTSADLSPTQLRVAALISQSLLALNSTIDLGQAKITTLHRIHRLLSLLFTVKPDACLDLLEIAANGTDRARRNALELLATFFPGNMGHNIIAKRLARTTYDTLQNRLQTGSTQALGEEDTEKHHYIPWRVSSKDGSGDLRNTCSTCEVELHGFAIRCTLCQDLKHLYCYDDTDGYFSYEVVHLASPNIAPKIVRAKFSRCLPKVSDLVLDRPRRGEQSSNRRQIGGHDFVRVNILSTVLCEGCHEPIWDVTGYACLNGCQRFYHTACADDMDLQGHYATCKNGQHVVIDNMSSQTLDPFSITLEKLQGSWSAHISQLCLDEDNLREKSYDELTVLYGSLWAKYQILKNGIQSGTIIIRDHKSPIDGDILGVRASLQLYDKQMEYRKHEASTSASDFAHVFGLESVLGAGYLYFDQFLRYCTALLRSPQSSTTDHAGSEGLLTASGNHPPSLTDTHQGSFEMLNTQTLHRSLAHDLHIYDPAIAALFLNQLTATGLISSQDEISSDDISSGKTWVSFGLPSLMDSSVTVEMLISAIEYMLEDLDLTMNEQALNLMINRCFPTLLCSPYALERLGNALVRWVMEEDNTLHTIVKDFASKHKRAPGVRAVPGATTQAAGNSSVTHYQDDRLRLLRRYAEPWLQALHNQDPSMYAHILYEQAKAPMNDLPLSITSTSTDNGAALATLALERMTAIVDSGVIFSALLDLLTAWLEDLGGLSGQDVIYKALPKLLRQHIPLHGKEDVAEGDEEDIWSLAVRTADEDGPDGLERVCRWMRVLSFSGVDVPWQTLLYLVEQQSKNRSSVEARLDLVIAVNANGANIEQGRLASISAKLLLGLSNSLGNGNSEHKTVESQESQLLRQTLLLVLRSHGVQQQDIAQMLEDNHAHDYKQPASLAKRRRATIGEISFPLDESIIHAAIGIISNCQHPPELLLDFMWLLFSRGTYISNINGTLHNLCEPLFEALWPLMDLPLDRKRRARVLLRLISVDAEPLERLLKRDLGVDKQHLALERLLRFCLELTDDTVTADNKSWRPAVLGTILIFLETLIHPDNVSIETLAIRHAIAISHLRAMSVCFEEYLAQSSDENRLIVLARIHRIRDAIPHWPILSWRAIEELITEEVTAVTQLQSGRSSQTVSALVDAQMVRSSLISLGLNTLASGISIPWLLAQRFQQHVAALCALPWQEPSEGIVNLVLPSLRKILDSPHRMPLGEIVAGKTVAKTILIGSLFVPVIIDFANELDHQDFLTKRCTLDILAVTFFKHNVHAVELSALGSLQKLADFILRDDCSENRLLANSIIRTAMDKMDRNVLVRGIPAIFCTMAEAYITTTQNNGDSAVIEQSRQLLRAIIKLFGKSGLFLHILRIDGARASEPGGASPTSYLGEAISRIYINDDISTAGSMGGTTRVIELLFSDLSEVLKRGRQTLEQVLSSLARLVVQLDKVTQFPENAIVIFGIFLGRLAKHVAEWTASEFDPNSILQVCSRILGCSEGSSTNTLAHQISTFLHLCLSKFNVSEGSISALLDSQHSLSNLKSQGQEDMIRTVVDEMTIAAIGGQTVTPVTLGSLLALYLRDHQSELPQANLVQSPQLVLGCTTILLRTHPTIFALTGPELLLPILSRAAGIILLAEQERPGMLAQAISHTISEASSIQINVFTYIFIAALEDPTQHIEIMRSIFNLFPILARAVALSLRGTGDHLAVVDTKGEGAELLSGMFTVVRLAVLASLHVSSGDKAAGDDAMEALWRRIWPDWFRLITLSVDVSCINSPLRSITHSVFLDLIIFLHSTGSNLLNTHLDSLSHAVQTLVHHVELTGSAGGSGKIIKAVTYLEPEHRVVGTNHLHQAVNLEDTVERIKADSLASERLRSLRSVPAI